MNKKTENADLSGSEFVDVNLDKAKFLDVNLAGAQFNDINLSGAVMRNANCSGVTMVNHGGTVVEQMGILQARSPFSSIPKGLRPPAQRCEARATLGQSAWQEQP